MQFDHGYPDLVGFGRRSIDASLVRLTRSTSSTDRRPAPAAIDDRTVGLLRARTLAEGHVVSEGVVRGAIQVPPGGEPVIFMADHPVSGRRRTRR